MPGTLSPTLPVLGSANATEDPKVRSSLITLRDGINAVLTSANQLDGAQIGAGTVPGSALAAAAGVALSKLASGTDAQLIVCNASGVPTYVSSSGDVMVSNTGVLTLGDDKVTSAKIADDAVGPTEIAANAVRTIQIGSLPCCILTKTANQSIPDNTNTAVTFDTEVLDTDTMHTGSASTITATTAGVYVVTATANFSSNSTGQRAVGIALGASPFTPLGGQAINAIGGGVASHLATAAIVKLAVADTVAMNVFQNSGGALNLLSTTASTFGDVTRFSAHWVGDG